MSLIISLRIPDGIVIAGDSLSTVMTDVTIQGEVEAECPQCGHQHTIGPQAVGGATIPSTTFSYAQKVFPFMESFGVGTFGQGQVAGKTIHFLVRRLEQELAETAIGSVAEAADKIGDHVQAKLRETVADFDQASDDWRPVGFQVVGYDQDEKATTISFAVGKTVQKEVYTDNGCTYNGQGHVVSAIWELYKKRTQDTAIFNSFSLQDAIEYADFLIRTTASYQQFSRTIPQVGGDIDVALVTPFDGFRWIRQKRLSRIVEKRGDT